jgi:hypothetical protein
MAQVFKYYGKLTIPNSNPIFFNGGRVPTSVQVSHFVCWDNQYYFIQRDHMVGARAVPFAGTRTGTGTGMGAGTAGNGTDTGAGTGTGAFTGAGTETGA